MNKGLLVILSGPSGSGKDTLLTELLKADDNVIISISSTTREIRENETHGVHYNFINKDSFEKMIESGELLEYAEYDGGKYYGTPQKPVEKWLNEGKTVILKIEVQGAEKIREKRPDAVGIFLMPPSVEELKKRLRERRTDSEESIRRRLETALTQEIPGALEYDYIVVNDNLYEAVSNVKTILAAERFNVNRMKYLIEEALTNAQSEFK